MSDDLFPSGPWTGFYSHKPGDKHRMDLDLKFAGGHVTGDGNDDVGRFLIRGGYDVRERECHWTKTYPGSHEVYYRGFREGKGIWGTWEIGLRGHGGFHIWPCGTEEEERTAESGEEADPVEAAGQQSLQAPLKLAPQSSLPKPKAVSSPLRLAGPPLGAQRAV